MFIRHGKMRQSVASRFAPAAVFGLAVFALGNASAQPRAERSNAGGASETVGVSTPKRASASTRIVPQKAVQAGTAADTDPATAGTPTQLLERGKAALSEIGVAGTSLTGLVAAAKDKRDVVKVLCLDDKKGQVEAALRTTEERVESLAVAAKHGADERARHEYLMVVTLRERVAVLMSEANQCLGEEAGFTGDAVLNVEIDATLPRVIAEVVPFSPVLFIPVSLNSGVY
jgi:hypothetical protein